MKILVVSNLYPPHYLGGYEVHCAQVAEAMQRAGHEVRVLTSVYGLSPSTWGNFQPKSEVLGGVRVDRWLHNYAFWPAPVRWPWTVFHAKRQLADARQFREILSDFQPDIVNWWNMNGLTKILLPIPGSCGIPDIHSIDDIWMINEYGPGGQKASVFWASLWDGNWGPRICRPLLRWIGQRWEKRIEQEGIPTRRLSHDPSHVCFLSEYLQTLHQEAGLACPSSQVVYGGVHPSRFYQPIQSPRHISDPLRILYAGQISHDRGLHTIVEAIGLLTPVLQGRLKLTVVGAGDDAYLSRIRAQVHTLGLDDRVLFLGMVLHAEIPRIYQQHDVLVFSSCRAEGLGFVNIEAMLAGCAVLTTGSGGAMEIALAANLPLFPRNDSPALSRLLSRMVLNRAEVVQIALRGQEVALREFSFDRMIDKWLATLQRLHEARYIQATRSSEDDAQMKPTAIHV